MLNFRYIILVLLFSLSGCSKETEDRPSVPSDEINGLMNKEAASEFLIHTLEAYREYDFNEIAADIGIGDNFEVLSEGDDGSRESYSVSVNFEWETTDRNSIVLTGTLFGPSPQGNGVLPEMRNESIVIRR